MEGGYPVLHAGPQGTPLESESFGGPPFTANLPVGLLEHTDDVVVFK